jgi:N-acetylmuramic acid 6-phosphate etherase
VKTEIPVRDYQDLDSWPLEKSLQALVESNRRAIDAVAESLPALGRAAARLVDQLGRGGRLVYVGAGTSGRLALQDAAELSPTFGFEKTVVLMAGGGEAGNRAEEGAEDDEASALQAMERAEVGSEDVVIGLAASGRTPFTLASIKEARRRGALTIGIANNAGSPLLDAAEIEILLDSGPEVLAGSTRLAAGTAQKVALNALSTSVMAKLGGAYSNLMVGMQPRNAKLRQRAITIVVTATGVTSVEATRALEASGQRIREAIVMLKTGRTLEQATALLQDHHQRVRDVLVAAGEEPL